MNKQRRANLLFEVVKGQVEAWGGLKATDSIQVKAI